LLRDLGAEPVACDVFDAAGLSEAVTAFRAEAVIHELTALPDDPSQIPEWSAANNRIRREGTRNLIAAASAASPSASSPRAWHSSSRA
jgi:nucleoside-diphosphate-sugar epimerase